MRFLMPGTGYHVPLTVQFHQPSTGADAWQPDIVRFYGGVALFLCIYLDHVPPSRRIVCPSVFATTIWNRRTSCSTGTRIDLPRQDLVVSSLLWHACSLLLLPPLRQQPTHYNPEQTSGACVGHG